MKKKRLNFHIRRIMPCVKQMCRVMKLVTFLLFVMFVQVSAGVFSQNNGRFSLKVEQESVNDILNLIEEQSNYTFMYNRNNIDVERKTDINCESKSIEEVLDMLFKGTGVKYRSFKNNYVLYTENAEFSGPTQQNMMVSGKVTDSSGSSLPGVTVVVKGTTQGTITDTDGNYSFSNVSADAVLLFSFVGMRTQEIAIAGKTVVNVTMIEETVGIDEVVAVGYGTQKKVNLTGAVSVMDSESLENRPIATTGQGLQGVIPNLNINFTSGDISENSVDYNIRGYESINGGSPYILVDGVPMDIEDINPNDIESISVLKDASAAAIYGGKAAFGVILVTTKSPKNKDKITVKYSHETALSTPIMKGYNAVGNSYDHVIYKNLMYTNDGAAEKYDEVYVAGVKAYYENPESAPEYAIVDNNFEFYGYNNYKDILMKDFSPSYKHNLTISGGTKKTDFFVSLGNFKKEGIYKYGTDMYTRNNILIKLTEELTDWISMDQKIAINLIKSNKSHDYGVNSIGPAAVNLYDPIKPVKFPENDLDYPEYAGMYFENVIGYLDEGGRTVNRSQDTWATAGLNLKPFKNLNIRGEISYNYKNSQTDDAVTAIQFLKTESITSDNPFTYGETDPTSASMTMNNARSYVFNTYAEYELKNLGSHYIKAMVGFNQEHKKWDKIGGTGYELITNEIAHIGATLGEQIVGGSSDIYSLRGGFYRLNYIYSDKYLLELSGRYDGSSRFPKEDRYGFFPSGSLGWRISEESFMKRFNFIDNLKLRASYGELGNQSISYDGEQQYHPYLSTMGISTAHYIVFDDSESLPQYTTIPELVSNNLTWETVATKDIGLDFTMLNQRLDGSFDYYIRKTKDMLLKKDYPEILSAVAPWENGADLETKGWEFSVSWRDKITNDLTYGLRFSLWDFKSTITKYYNVSNSLDDYYVGQEIGEIWGYETVGLFQDQTEITNGPDQSSIGTGWKPGDVLYKDQLTVDTDGDGIADEGDGVIDPGSSTLDDHGDMKIIGNRTPRYSYSFTLDLNYKNWGITAFFQGIGKKDYYPNSNFSAWWPWAVNGAIKQTDITDSWTSENTDAYWYRATSSGSKNISTQTRWLQDASYLRLKSLVLNYSLPLSLIRKVGMSKADVFISGQNLWEISNFVYNRDPEQNIGNNLDPFENVSGPNHISYPSQRTFSVGVNVTF